MDEQQWLKKEGREAELAIQAAGACDAGYVRPQNEDRYLIDPERHLFIVSDGMGGRPAGGLASTAVITVLPSLLNKSFQSRIASTEVIEQSLRDAIMELSQRLRAESAGRAGLQGMGATVALAWLRSSLVHLAHLGDSRIYLMRQESLVQVTQDHSAIALLLRYGEITPEQAQTHPARGRLSRYVGMDDTVLPDIQTIPLQRRDRLLLCTDGLTTMLSDAQVEQVLRMNSQPEVACQALVQAACEAGGADNITALVVNCE